MGKGDHLRNLMGWLTLVPLVLLILFCSGQLSVWGLRPSAAQNVHSQLTAYYEQWPYEEVAPMNLAVLDIIRREDGQGEGIEVVVPGVFLPTPTPTRTRSGSARTPTSVMASRTSSPTSAQTAQSATQTQFPTRTALPPTYTQTLAVPSATVTPVQSATSSLTPAWTKTTIPSATRTVTLASTRTATYILGMTATRTRTPTRRPTRTATRTAMNIGPGDGSYIDIGCGSGILVDLGNQTWICRLVYYEAANPADPGYIALDWVIVSVSANSTGPWTLIFYWGGTNPRSNGDITSYPQEDDNQRISFGELYNQSGIRISVTGIYRYVLIEAPPGCGDPAQVDAIEVLP